MLTCERMPTSAAESVRQDRIGAGHGRASGMRRGRGHAVYIVGSRSVCVHTNAMRSELLSVSKLRVSQGRSQWARIDVRWAERRRADSMVLCGGGRGVDRVPDRSSVHASGVGRRGYRRRWRR